MHPGRIPPVHPKTLARVWLVLLTVVLLLPGSFALTRAAAGDDAPAGQLLEAKCVKCHGGGKLEGGLDLRNAAAILKGGDSGPAVVPGKPEESLLIQKVQAGEMPPGKKGPLVETEQALLRRWVTDQATWSAQHGSTAAPTAAPPTRLSDEDRRFWSFQPPRRPGVPAVRNVRQVRTPIDAFLLARLEAKGLSFNAEAGRETQLRRLCFDLTGLPPTLAQREQFLGDTRPDAYERLVDRLLASPAYGERWGRHWLDIAGYADSDGYLAADRERPEAWRYRDYVVAALNRDLPYDRFLTEQLAGDELSRWREADTLTAATIEQLAATGFLRTASDPTYPGYTEPNEIHQVLSDTTQIVASTFLGITLQCARCHAHKFDPISQRDYYAFQSIFLPALDPARWQPSSVRGIPMATDGQLARLKEENQRVAERLKPLEEKLKAQAPGNKQEIERLKAAIAAESARKRPDPVLIRGLTNLPGKPPEGHIFHRGDYTKLGASVSPGVPEVLAQPNEPTTWRETAGSATGRRLALSRWLTAADNPLTARVQVNRMWAHHFGRGLVPTIANLGRSGARPSHPELLDWLATEFIRAGWSMKAMHRLMVNSTAYRQSSQVEGGKPAADPDNVLLSSWRPRRLEGEVLRDTILEVAGKLAGTRHGPPAPVSVQADGSVETADDAQGNRRSIYVVVRRSQHLTLLDLFDTPMMEINCPQRAVSTVPLQALALLNGPFAERNAAALAARILREAPDDAEARIRTAYRLVYTRDPTTRELARIVRFQRGLSEPRRADEKPADRIRRELSERSAWAQTMLVLMNSNEFVYVN